MGTGVGVTFKVLRQSFIMLWARYCQASYPVLGQLLSYFSINMINNIHCDLSLELPYKAVQMSVHNVCFYEESKEFSSESKPTFTLSLMIEKKLTCLPHKY